MDGSLKQYSSAGIKTLMRRSAILPQAIDSLQSSTNCHFSANDILGAYQS
jgi:ribosomal protein S19